MSATLNRGLIWGQLLANLDRAREALRAAQCNGLVLDVAERKRLEVTVDLVTGLEQRAWTAQQRAAGTPRKRRR